MDSANDESVQTICLMVAAQTGKTETINNIVGFFIDADPAPILLVQPTKELVESWSKERLDPMLRDCACFSGKVKESRSRDSGNTIFHKQFRGGNIAMVGANAPSGLAGRPRRVVLLDEVDRYPESAGGEGDPCALAIRRTESFYNSVIVLTSTPTLKGRSRIESEFEQTDKRYWFCPCPKCKKHQTLKWENIIWPEGNPEQAFLRCEHCHEALDDSQRVWMIRHGEWRATAEFHGKRGYHLNGIYSPFKHKRGYKNRLHQMAAQFIEAEAGGEETQKAWRNTFLAETWESKFDKLNPDDIYSRREDYAAEVPEGVLVLTGAADVQSDRIEAEIIGWGDGEECWGIKRGYFLGNPNTSTTVWRQLADFILSEFTHPIYGKMSAKKFCVDSGYATSAAYKFCRSQRADVVHAVKGSPKKLKNPVEAPKRNSRSQALLVDTVEFKTVIYSRLKIQEPGPRYCHFPKGYDEEFFAQLTAEKTVSRWVKGILRQEWENVRASKRNEALDIRVYNHAALHLLSVNWEKLKANLQKQGSPKSEVVNYDLKPTPTAPAPTPRPPQPNPRQRSGGGWISGGGFGGKKWL